jgi:hypothetical protein
MVRAGFTCAEIAVRFGVPPLAAGGIGALCAGLEARGYDPVGYAEALAERLVRYL